MIRITFVETRWPGYETAQIRSGKQLIGAYLGTKRAESLKEAIQQARDYFKFSRRNRETD